jgi:hypothetical protein
MKYPSVLTSVDDERVSPELAPLLYAAYRSIQGQAPDLADLRSALRDLFKFLSSKKGRTNANCSTTDSFFLEIDNNWQGSRDHLPEAYQDLLGDIGGCLHDAVSAPEMAENFESTPEQLLERLERLASRCAACLERCSRQAPFGLRLRHNGGGVLAAELRR